MQKRLLFLLMMLFYMCITGVWAQESGQVLFPPECLVLGPFYPDDLDRDFLADVGGEANIGPKAGDTVTTSEGTVLTWKRHEPWRQFVTLTTGIGNYKGATGYAFYMIQSETAGSARIFFGNTGPSAVWINGKQVHRTPHGKAHASSSFEAELKEGPNRCLVKLVRRSGAWIFAMRIFLPHVSVVSGTITDTMGEPVFGASVRLEQNEEAIAQMSTDEGGSYCLGIYPASGIYDLSATAGESGNWQLNIPIIILNSLT